MSLVSSMLAAKRYRLFHYLLSAPVFHQCQVIMAILAAIWSATKTAEPLI